MGLILIHVRHIKKGLWEGGRVLGRAQIYYVYLMASKEFLMAFFVGCSTASVIRDYMIAVS